MHIDFNQFFPNALTCAETLALFLSLSFSGKEKEMFSEKLPLSSNLPIFGVAFSPFPFSYTEKLSCACMDEVKEESTFQQYSRSERFGLALFQTLALLGLPAL